VHFRVSLYIIYFSNNHSHICLYLYHVIYIDVRPLFCFSFLSCLHLSFFSSLHHYDTSYFSFYCNYLQPWSFFCSICCFFLFSNCHFLFRTIIPKICLKFFLSLNVHLGTFFIFPETLSNTLFSCYLLLTPLKSFSMRFLFFTSSSLFFLYISQDVLLHSFF
jgi:hypothetical protein